MTSLRDEQLTPTREGTTASLGERGVEPDVAIGSRVGRYLLLERIGVGGMGVVYAAYDPELDRKVAVKLLQDRQGRAHVEGERDRLVAEAQALARLNHPNVVTVHDVGVDAEDRVFVAMAYLRGPTLGRWRKRQERTWEEVVRMLVAAGRGLAAAHQEGIVHRDFKPDNVIVADRQDDRPGRPRVLDFGLALEAGEGGEVESELAALGTSRAGGPPLTSSADSPAEGAGRLVGTPAYMAPELYLRQPGDVLSDQFAFCVTAWELLYRERPFRGDNRIALATAIVTGPLIDPPASANVPRFVERALRRGLRKDPVERWSSLAALLEALTDDPAARRRRRWIWGGVVAASGAAVWLLATRDQPDPCAYGQTRVAKAWGPDKEAILRASFRATGVPYAQTTAQRTVQDLDAYAAQWVASHRDACEATHVRHEQSGRRLDARMGCLETQLDALSMAASLMLNADARVVEHAAAALASLPESASCAAVRVDRGPPPPQHAIAAQVQRVRSRVAEASPWLYVGRVEEALAVMVALVEECDEVGYLPLRAEVLLGLGEAQSAAGLVPEAASTLREAAFTALEAGHDRIHARAALLSIRVEGIERSDYEAAALWTAHAKAVVSRLAEPGRVATELEYRQCRVLSDQGDIEGALPHCRAAVALSSANVGSEHIDTVHARLGLGIAFYMAGDLDEAEPRFRAALVASRALHGPSHPSQAVPLQALAAICYARDGGASCIEAFEQAYRAAVAGSGPQHPAVADYANNLALAYLGAERVDDAERRARQAMDIREATGEAHPGIAASHRILGEVASRRGQPQLAREHYDAAIDGARQTRGPKHHDVVAGLRLRATLAVEQGDRVSAIADLEAALVAQEGITMPPEDLAELQWKLGQALLAEDPATRSRAVSLVREAQQGYPASAATEHAAVAAWLREYATGLPPGSDLAIER